jgi:predicted  nucleic acid-binding Zn-ribbon protein
MAVGGEKGGGGKGDSTRRGQEEGKMTSTKLYSAIEKVEKFMASLRANKDEIDAWNAMKKAAIHTNEGQKGPLGAEDLRGEFKRLYEAIKGIGQKTKEMDTRGMTYTRAAKGEADKVIAVPARRAREVVMALGAETEEQKARTNAQVVKDIQEIMKDDKSVVAARRLLTGKVVVTFSQLETKEKWEKKGTIA